MVQLAQAGKMYYPEIVRVDLTGDCNLRCKHCQTAMFLKNKSHDLSTGEWKRIIKEIANSGGMLLTILGGEPLLRPDLAELIEFSCSLGLKVALTTNGLLVNELTAPEIARTCSFIAVSFDGPDAESHDLMRGKGSFSRALRGLYLLASELKKLPSPRATISISVTLNKYSSQNFEKFVDLAADAGVDQITIAEVHSGGRAAQNWGKISIGESDLRSAGVRFIKRVWERSYDGELRLDFFTARFRDWIKDIHGIHLPKIDSFDNSGVNECYIQHDGLMFPSQQLSYMRPENLNGFVEKLHILPEANDLRTTSFEKIWNGEFFQKYRNFVIRRAYWADFAGCGGCEHLGRSCDPGVARWMRGEPNPHALCYE